LVKLKREQKPELNKMSSFEITVCRHKHQNPVALIPPRSACETEYFRVTGILEHAAFELNNSTRLST